MAGDLARRRNRLGQALLHVALVEQPLPLQIAELDVVAIDDAQKPNPGPRQRARLKAALKRRNRPPPRARPIIVVAPLRRCPGTESAANIALELARRHTPRWYQPMR